VDNVMLLADLSNAAPVVDSAIVHDNYTLGAWEGIHEGDLAIKYCKASTEVLWLQHHVSHKLVNSPARIPRNTQSPTAGLILAELLLRQPRRSRHPGAC
jgi:hypothetical protein